MASRHGGKGGGGGSDAEVIRLAYEAMPAQKKMSINMGSAFGDYSRRYNWLMQLVQEGIMSPYTALKLQIANHIHSERLGNMHLELMTRDDVSRYHALSRIKGVRKEPGQIPQPIPKAPGDEFFSFECSAFISTADLQQQYGSVFDVLAKRIELVSVEKADREIVKLPAWVPALRNYVIDAVSALPNMYSRTWYTNKMKTQDDRKAMKLKRVRDIVENFEENLDYTLKEELKDMFMSLPVKDRIDVIRRTRERFARRKRHVKGKEDSEKGGTTSDG